jgi:hypothetical protein
MNLNDLMNKIKQWNYRAEQWLGRHFYILLFEAILSIIFLFAFINLIKLIILSFNVSPVSVSDQLLLAESINTSLIVMLLILLSLGVLNLINGNTRFRNILKNIEFNLSKRRSDQKSQD